MFYRKFISDRNEKSQILINKLVYLGLSMLDLTKTVMFGFWYNYVKPKHGESAKLCYMDAASYLCKNR